MDSINKNQPEENRKDLRGPEAVARIRELVGRAENGFFRAAGVRPMNVREVDDRGHLWFLAADDSSLIREIEADPNVELSFQGSPHSDFLCLRGRATLSREKARIHELWEPILGTWFTGGEEDPRVTVIEVCPSEGYYWDLKHGSMVAGIKMIIGAAIGRTMDDSIEGELRV